MVSWRGGRGRGRCVTSEEVRLDRGRRQNWLTVAGPMPRAVCGSVRTGRPLAGKGEVLGGQGLLLLIDLRVSLGTAWGEAAR